MGRRVKIHPRRGSHLVPLLACLRATSGPVLELGAGIYSTPLLHAVCDLEHRYLVTCENDSQFYEWASHYKTPGANGFQHSVFQYAEWDDAKHVIAAAEWSVALVDHAPDERRRFEVKRLTHCEYVVVHDTDPGWGNKYKFDRVFPLYKYQRRYEVWRPHTTVLSNFHTLEDLW